MKHAMTMCLIVLAYLVWFAANEIYLEYRVYPRVLKMAEATLTAAVCTPEKVHTIPDKDATERTVCLILLD